MWILESNAQPGDKSYPILGDHKYVVGRQNCDIVVADPSVSRRQAVLTMAHYEANVAKSFVVPTLTLEDVSKFGTFVNGKPVKTAGGNTLTLKDNDLIKFGGTPDSIYRAKYQPFLATTSCLEKNPKKALQRAMCLLGGHLVRDWRPACHLLIMSKINVTLKVICAINNQKHIVTPKYLDDLYQHLMGRQEKPDPSQYLPEVVDTEVPEHVSFHPDIRRQTLLSELKFYFLSPLQFNKTNLAVSTAGGLPILLEDGTEEEAEAMTNEGTVVVLVTRDVMETLSPASVKFVKTVMAALRRKNLRMITDPEIGTAILTCNMIDYCNPRAPLAPNLQAAMASQMTMSQMTDMAGTQQTPADVKPEFRSPPSLVTGRLLKPSSSQLRSQADPPSSQLRSQADPPVVKPEDTLEIGGVPGSEKTLTSLPIVTSDARPLKSSSNSRQKSSPPRQSCDLFNESVTSASREVVHEPLSKSNGEITGGLSVFARQKKKKPGKFPGHISDEEDSHEVVEIPAKQRRITSSCDADVLISNTKVTTSLREKKSVFDDDDEDDDGGMSTASKREKKSLFDDDDNMSIASRKEKKSLFDDDDNMSTVSRKEKKSLFDDNVSNDDDDNMSIASRKEKKSLFDDNVSNDTRKNKSETGEKGLFDEDDEKPEIGDIFKKPEKSDLIKSNVANIDQRENVNLVMLGKIRTDDDGDVYISRHENNNSDHGSGVESNTGGLDCNNVPSIENKKVLNRHGATGVDQQVREGWITSKKDVNIEEDIKHDTEVLRDEHGKVVRNVCEVEVAPLVARQPGSKITDQSGDDSDGGLHNFKKFKKTVHAGAGTLPTVIGGRDLEEHCSNIHSHLEDLFTKGVTRENERAEEERQARDLFDWDSKMKSKKPSNKIRR